MKKVVTQVVKLKNLQSFHYIPVVHQNSYIPDIFRDHDSQLDRLQFATNHRPLRQSSRKRAFDVDLLKSIIFPHLSHLVLHRSTLDLIKHKLDRLILHIAGNSIREYFIDHVLNFLDFPVPIIALEQMICNLPFLRHLELVCACGKRTVDGQRLEIIAKNLTVFRFYFSTFELIATSQLDSFRTPLWLNDKRWFVACTELYFYSIPPLCTRKFNISSQCSNTHTLRTPSHATIRTIIDLRRIRNLTLAHYPRNFSILHLINEMPNLNQLSIQNGLLDLLEEIPHQIFDQIRTLKLYEVHIPMNGNGDKMGNLFTTFPYLKHLYVSCFCSVGQIRIFLHGFKHVSAALFSFIQSPNDASNKYHFWNTGLKLQWMRRTEGLNFTYRFDSSDVFIYF